MMAWVSGSFILGAERERLHHRRENAFAVLAAEPRVAGAVGVGHQAENVARAVANARDVRARAVGVGRDGRLAGLRIDVAHEHLIVRLQFGQRGVVGVVTTLAVGDGHAQDRCPSAWRR